MLEDTQLGEAKAVSGARERKLKQESLIVKPVYSVMNPQVYFGRKSEVLCNFLQGGSLWRLRISARLLLILASRCLI